MTHGTIYAYRQGCRCDECRARMNMKKAAQKARRLVRGRALTSEEVEDERRSRTGAALPIEQPVLPETIQVSVVDKQFPEAT